MDLSEFRSASFNVRIFLAADIRHPQQALIRVIREIRGQIPFDLSRSC